MNGMIIAACSNCQARFEVSGDLVGKQGKCPRCQAVFTIGGQAPKVVPPPPLPPSQQFSDALQPPTVPKQFSAPHQGGVPATVPADPMKPHRGRLVLGMALGGIFLVFPLLIVAIVLGKTDLKQMDQGLMDPSGRGMTQTGVVLGYVFIVVTVIVSIVIFLYCSALIRELLQALGELG